MLGIGIERDREKRVISFSQTAYIQKMIEHFRPVGDLSYILIGSAGMELKAKNISKKSLSY